ncbi:beta-xylanase [Acrocarpospora phusangensis]|uniref:Beta-xylanase n=1 Tax=Acrocarpospora phusangensis TaxID=1070424 RepID=A0A919Q8V3_9ACTN|nr:endo-1,4-beta-xylanase [Acrocarpospora phusangensis]GIH22815.1 beta-xylanase [Acrocarpospora phusangensis]
MRHSRLGTRLAVVLTAVSLSMAIAAPASAGGGDHHKKKTLGELAEARGRYFGSATDNNPQFTNPDYLKILGEEFNHNVAGNALKWYATEPQRGVFDFTLADQIFDFARKHRQSFRGHTLIWHNQLPEWLTTTTWTADELRAVLKNHIFKVVKQYKGRILAWDVVNEAFNEDGTYRQTLFYNTLGPGYIADALRWAHQADPKAKLYLNDYNIEGIGPKSDAYYNLMKQLKKDRVPVHGLGVQGHLALQFGFPTTLRENLQRFADLGFDVAITELDIRMILPADDAKLATQAQWYADVTRACLAVRRCVGITVWDYTDKYSWIPQFFPGEGAAHPWDENLLRKPAYDAIKAVLRAGH